MVEGGTIPPLLRAQWWSERGRQWVMNRDPRARAMNERALDMHRALGDDTGEFLALGCIVRASLEASDDLEEICAAMGPRLKELGLIFVGIDVIGGKWLTEINVTSPTGIVAIDKFNGTDTAGRIWDAIEAKAARG